jgi:PAS domain S-box-containing protein
VIYTCKLYGDYANTFVSQNVTAQFGYVPEEIMKDSRFWVNHVHSEDRQLVLDSMNSLIKEGHYIHEYRLQHKDGTYRRIRDEMKLIRNESGNPMEAIGYMIDITQPDLMDGGRRKHGLSVWKRAERLEDAVEYRTRELIESEARYRDLVENIPDRVFAKDRNSVYVSCNKQYAYDFNIKSDEIRGKTDYDFYPRELADQYRAVDKRVIGSGRAEELEERYVARGQEFTVATIKTPLRDSAGNVSGVLGIFRDITERKRMEKMRDEFVADVTDELIIPLTSMKGYVDLMLSEHESVPQDFMERLEVVKRNTDRLINLTGQLLDLRRLMVARFFLHFESMDLRESIRDAVRETQPFVNKKKLALNVNLPDRPLMVRGDQTRLKEAIIALLSNATKFTAEEGKISLSAGETDTMVDVQISDTGIGIRSEDLKRVFEPFPAIQHADYVKGTGLALSLTKGLIEAHGGKIWVESAGEGEGATFTLTLPKAKQKQTDPLSLHL